MRRLGANTPAPYRRMETEPGEEAQIDFGTVAWVVDQDGKRRRPWMLCVVLSCSRKAYSEVVYRQTTDNFIAVLENAFHHFGGVPKRLVIDNLKAAVKRADWYDPEIHPKLQSFAAHYGAVFLPTKPYTPRHKGTVESDVKYAKNNALAGRTSLNRTRYLLQWEETVADTRIHGTTKKQVRQQFEAVERPSLLPLPPDRFALFHEARRTVNRDGHLEVDTAYYSAPPEYVGRRVWVRWDAHLVRVFNDQWKQIALHSKCEPGRFRTDGSHIPAEKASAAFRDQKHLDDFDFEFNPSVKRKQIFDLAAGDFVRKHRDAILLDPPGTGKSHLVQSIGRRLIRSGLTAYYRSIFDCVRDFLHDEAFEGHDRILSRYLKPDLLILDDMGMKQLPKKSGETCSRSSCGGTNCEAR